MSTKRNKVIAVALLAAFGLWIAFAVFPVGTGNSSRKKAKQPYEPQFKKEGNLAFLDSLGTDTILSLDIELAENAQEIQYGMMYRRHIPENTGMLFLMGNEEPRSFWMRNTYVSLDIIYINEAMEVVSIQKNAEPLNDRSLPSEGPASLVLEVAGGFSDANGIGKGTKVAYSRD